MKTFAALVFILLSTSFAFSSALVFKTKKEITSAEFVDLAEVRTRDFKEIKVVVKFVPKRTENPKLPDWVNLLAVEDEDAVWLDGGKNEGTYSKFFEVSPTKLKIQVRGAGSYSVFVWANPL